jgi:integrase
MADLRRRSGRSEATLASAIEEFLETQRYYLRASTYATYRSHLLAFSSRHAEMSVGDLAPAIVRRHLAELLRAGKRYAARNRCIALRAVARYLATDWGIPRSGRSLLSDLAVPAVPGGGRSPYRPAEVMEMWGIIRRAAVPGRALWSAVFWLLLGTGLRSGEARQLARLDVELSDGRPGSIGHVVIRAESAKSAAGVREVPLDPRAERSIRSYLRGRESVRRGSGPLFVSAAGAAFTADGWNAMQQRIRRTIRDAGGPHYQPHRLRNTWARDMLEADVPETVIVQLAGWADGEMLRRYVGRLSVPALKRYPTTLAKYAARDGSRGEFVPRRGW